jgi:hypothetical protein
VKHIREKALKQFPLLERWRTDDFGWPDLMFIESQAMLGAMVQLMNKGIPSLTDFQASGPVFNVRLISLPDRARRRRAPRSIRRANPHH